MALLPQDAELRWRLAQCFNESRQSAKALEVVHDGLKLFPQSPVLWQALARSTINSPEATDQREAESAARRAIELSPAYWDAADLLAWMLTRQHRFDDARAIVAKILPSLPDPAPALGRLACITWDSGNQQPAVDEMTKVLEQYPDYQWGWYCLMDWLEAMDSAPLTWKLLENVPAQVRTQPEITARRLGLLTKSSGSVLTETSDTDQKLERVWLQALEEFPRNENLQLTRFDMLADREQWDQAAAVLDYAAQMCSPSNYILLRRVRLAAHQKNVAMAVESAMSVLRDPQPTSPCDAVWQVLINAGLHCEAFQGVADSIAKGEQVNVYGVRYIIYSGKDLGGVRINRKPRHHYQILRWLIETTVQAGWDRDHIIAAAAIEKLNSIDRGYIRRFLRRRRQLCLRHTALWEAIGHHLVVRGARRRTRKWLADWRSRKGVGMSAVANLRLSYRHPRRSQWQGIYEACRDALTRLPQDNTLVMIVTWAAEAMAAIGHDQELVQLVARYKSVLEPPDLRYWIPAYYRDQGTIAQLCKLAEMISCNEPTQAVSIYLRLKYNYPNYPVVQAGCQATAPPMAQPDKVFPGRPAAVKEPA